MWEALAVIAVILLLLWVAGRVVTGTNDTSTASQRRATDRLASPNKVSWQSYKRAERVARGEATAEEAAEHETLSVAERVARAEAFRTNYGPFSLEEAKAEGLWDERDEADEARGQGRNALKEWFEATPDWEKQISRRIYIEYTDGDGEHSERVVDAQRLYSKGNRLYVSGYCHEREAERNFLFDRIEYMEDRETGEVFDTDEVALALATMIPESD